MKFKAYQIFLPIAIGFGVIAWLFFREFDPEEWRRMSLTDYAAWGVVLAVLAVIGRDFGLTWRFHHLSDSDLTWRQSLRVCLLCEFTSAVTPTAVGGSAFSLYFMSKEGLSLGRSTTLMMTTLFFDELIFVVLCPIVVAIVPYSELLCIGQPGLEWLPATFWIVYAVIFIWTAVLFMGIVVKPSIVTSLINYLFRLPFIRRWRRSAEKLCHDMMTTSEDLHNKRFGWWAKGFAATAVSWISRFLVVNAILIIFIPAADHLLVLCRQFAVWLVLMFAPTPGGSGLSEGLFMTYYGDIITTESAALAVTVVWRLFSYYLYLAIGAILLPSWFSRNATKHDEAAPVNS